MKSIEDIILDRDQRGISEVRKLVPSNFCERSSNLILKNPGKILITTGFYILSAGAAETDGPPGAIAIGNGLEKLGYQVTYVTDRYAHDLMINCKSESSKVIEFPIASIADSKTYAANLLDSENPSVLLSIERCAASDDEIYRNMRNADISDHTARIDLMFPMHEQTVGIGDGGNEIGMGNIRQGVLESQTLVTYPAVATVNELIISSVSNWGGYGLLAALSIQTNKNLLPSPEEDNETIIKMVDMGAVDGFSGEQTYKVDGFELEGNSLALRELHSLVDEALGKQ